MVTVVHHALLQGVLGSKVLPLLTSLVLGTFTRDIYHPDFSLGRPAYFDLSVRCTTQPAFISSAASQAGVAAAAGEEAKDNRYLDSVTNDGGDFIPLVCESFGVWSPLLCPLFLQLLTALQLKMVCLGSWLGGNCCKGY